MQLGTRRGRTCTRWAGAGDRLSPAPASLRQVVCSLAVQRLVEAAALDLRRHVHAAHEIDHLVDHQSPDEGVCQGDGDACTLETQLPGIVGQQAVKACLLYTSPSP